MPCEMTYIFAKWVSEETGSEKRWELMFADKIDIFDKLAEEACGAQKR